DNMLLKAREGFGTMTELADVIVRQSDLSFHESYVLVSRLVAEVNGAGKKADTITTGMIDKIAVDLYKKPLKLPADVVKNALDPVENVNIRARIGGPAPVEVERMLKKRFTLQETLSKHLQKQNEDLIHADKILNEAVTKIIG
ncbi:MAG: hypothetical protein ABIJ65_04915, partial [Chloroflexota bacterium]